jgi:hypothetical protein
MTSYFPLPPPFMSSYTTHTYHTDKPVFYYKLQSSNGYWQDGRTGERRKIPEQLFLLFVFLFGIAFMFLSTYSFITAIVKHDE